MPRNWMLEGRKVWENRRIVRWVKHSSFAGWPMTPSQRLQFPCRSNWSWHSTFPLHCALQRGKQKQNRSRTITQNIKCHQMHQMGNPRRTQILKDTNDDSLRKKSIISRRQSIPNNLTLHSCFWKSKRSSRWRYEYEIAESYNKQSSFPNPWAS